MGNKEETINIKRCVSDEEENNAAVPLDFPDERSVTVKSEQQQAQHDSHHHKQTDVVAVESSNHCIPNDVDGALLKNNNESTPAAAVKEIGVIKNVIVDEEISYSGRFSDNEENQDVTLLLNTRGELYGREEEKNQLLEAFYRSISSTRSNNEIVLVTGESGTGKTALANTLREPVVARGGYFVSGKFDQLQKPEPYGTFVAAFTEYTHLVIDKGEKTMLSTKKAILDAMGSETRFVTDMIPALEQIVGPQSEISMLKGATDAQKRHNIVFCKFIRAICSYDCPLVLFIDDLQWSDHGSVDLLEALITDKEIEGLMVVGTCRHNEISRDHKLSYMLRKVEDNRLALIKNIEVQNLSEENINEFVSNVLQKQPSSSSLLASITYEQTGGNIFFVVQFLKSLFENGVLYMEEKSSDSKWRLNEDVVRTMRSCNDVIELLVEKMLNLPIEVQEMLKVAACIGSVFDEYLLFEVLTISNVEEVILAAVDLDLITANSGQHGGYRFGHDKTQQAAYSLIPESERNAFHLYIGRCLLDNLPAEELDMNLFIVVNQLSWGVDLIQDQKEKDNLASLCLRSCEKAASSSDFVTAAGYLRLGIDLLGENHWKDQYFLSLDIFNAAAEMEYCIGDFERVDMLVEAVLSNARILRDKVRAYTTQVNSLGARKKLDMAIDKGFEILMLLGERFPPKPRKVQLIGDLLKTKMMLRKMTDNDLLSLPQMHEWDKIAAKQILNLLSMYTYIEKPDYLPFVALRMVQLTLKYGISAISAPGFAMYGLLHTAVGNTDEGYRYGQLALRILAKFKVDSWLPRVYTIVYFTIFIWKNPIRTSLGPLRKAYQVGLQTGDMEFSMVAAYYTISSLFHSGQPLDISRTEVNRLYKLMSVYKQESVLSMAKPLVQMMLNFMGQSLDPFVLTGDVFDEESALKKARECKNDLLVKMIYIWKLVLAYYFHDYILAYDMALLSETIGKINKSTYSCCIQFFYNGLSCLALAKASRTRTKKHKSTAKKELERLKKFEKKCTHNFSNKVLLMEAEFAIVENKVDAAMLKYDASIAKAQLEGLRHEQALACERAGIALLHSGDKSRGLSYLSRARSLYEEWGAHAKVEQMKKTVMVS